MNRKIITLVFALLLTSCGGNSPQPTVKNYTLGTIKQLDLNFLVNWQVLTQIIINQNNKIAYILTKDGYLYHIDLKSGLSALLDKKNWQKLILTDVNKDDSPGMAKLDQKEPELNKRAIYTTKDGILVTTILESGGKSTAALAYFEKTELIPKYAWIGIASHGALIDGALEFTNALATEYNGQEYFIVQAKSLDATTGNKIYNLVSLTSGPKEFSGHWTASSGSNFDSSKLAADQDYVYVVENSSGVNIINKDNLGKVAKAQAITPGAQSDQWKFPGEVQDNNLVHSVVHHDGNLYIGLDVVDAKDGSGLIEYTPATGGVAVYDIKNQVTAVPNALWDQELADNLRVQDGQVLASQIKFSADYYRSTQAVGEKFITDTGKPLEPLSLFTLIINSKFTSEQDLQNKTFVDGKTFYTGTDPGLEYEVINNGFRVNRSISFEGDFVIELSENELDGSIKYLILTHEKKSFTVPGK